MTTSFESASQRNETLSDNIATYLINLECSQERLANVTNILEMAGITFSRIAAVDGRQRSAEQFPQYSHRSALNRYGRPMSGPEVGCFLSHRRCIEAFLSTSKQYALVFEDDVRLPSGFQSVLQQVISLAQHSPTSTWDVVNLGNPPKKHSHPIGPLSAGQEVRFLHRCYYFPLGTFGLLWSRIGAERFLEKSRIVYEPIDQFLRDWCAKDGVGLALSPAPVDVDRSQSYIRPNWSDRINLNLLRYWVIKNWRLMKNNLRARRLWQSGTDWELKGTKTTPGQGMSNPATSTASQSTTATGDRHSSVEATTLKKSA